MSTQVIVSTQSSLLLDHFEPEDVLVADRVDGGTRLTAAGRPKPLEKWLDDYSLGQLWEKNEFGGRPVPGWCTVARLLIHVEGQTEVAFVNEILRDHLGI